MAKQQKATFKLADRKRNPVGTFTAYGKSRKAAIRNGRRILKNITAGFYDEEGEFHPIRASRDYDPGRVGEGRKKRSRSGKKKRSRPAQRSLRYR